MAGTPQTKHQKPKAEAPEARARPVFPRASKRWGYGTKPKLRQNTAFTRTRFLASAHWGTCAHAIDRTATGGSGTVTTGSDTRRQEPASGTTALPIRYRS